MDDNRKLLYDSMKKEGLYSKSFEDFTSQFSTTEKVESLYNFLKEEKVYSKSSEDFTSQFFNGVDLAVKKKDGTTDSEISSEESQPSPDAPIAESPSKNNTQEKPAFEQAIEDNTPSIFDTSISNLSQKVKSNLEAAKQTAEGNNPYPWRNAIPKNNSILGPDEFAKKKKETEMERHNAERTGSKKTRDEQREDFANTEAGQQAEHARTTPRTEDIASVLNTNFKNLDDQYSQLMLEYLNDSNDGITTKFLTKAQGEENGRLSEKDKSKLLFSAIQNERKKLLEDGDILMSRKRLAQIDEEAPDSEYFEKTSAFRAKWNENTEMMKEYIKLYPEEAERLRSIKARKSKEQESLVIKETDSPGTKVFKQARATVGGVQNSVIDMGIGVLRTGL